MASSSEGFKLSASQKSRLDVDIPFLWPHWGASVCKWLFTIVLALMTLCGAVASRMALIAIPIRANSNPSSNTILDPEYEVKASNTSTNNAEMFLALVIVIMVPYLIEFARCLWLHGIVPGHNWPSPVAVFVVSIYMHTIMLHCMSRTVEACSEKVHGQNVMTTLNTEY